MDNITAVANINQLGGSSEELDDLMRTIWSYAQSQSITLTARHLAGKKNQHADRLSRNWSPYEWMLNRKVFIYLDQLTVWTDSQPNTTPCYADTTPFIGTPVQREWMHYHSKIGEQKTILQIHRFG